MYVEGVVVEVTLRVSQTSELQVVGLSSPKSVLGSVCFVLGRAVADLVCPENHA